MALNDAIRSFGRRIRPDPLSGKIDLNAITQYVMNNLDDPDVITSLQHAKEQFGIRSTQKEGLRNMDYTTLPVDRHNIWLIKLHLEGLRDADGQPISAKNASQQGVRQWFHLYSFNQVGPGMDEGMYRTMEEFEGIPNSKQVEDFIRGAMAMPFPPIKPCLPEMLVLSSNLGIHEAALRPFLDSLPAPFEWHVAPVEMEAEINEIGHEGEKIRFREYLKYATQKKDDGNKEYGAKNSQPAVKCYEDAIDILDKATARLGRGDKEMTKEARDLQAICFANSSIARLLTGQEEDIKKSIKDAEWAIDLNPSYAKGYVRLSRAYEAQGKVADAEEALVQALRLPELENCKGLVDHLISLQTGGKGLPTDAEGFPKWSEETFSEGQERATRMQGVGGLWLKLCNEHVEKMRSLAKTQD